MHVTVLCFPYKLLRKDYYCVSQMSHDFIVGIKSRKSGKVIESVLELQEASSSLFVCVVISLFVTQ